MELNNDNLNLEIIKLDNIKHYTFLFMFDKKTTVLKKEKYFYLIYDVNFYNGDKKIVRSLLRIIYYLGFTRKNYIDKEKVKKYIKPDISFV